MQINTFWLAPLARHGIGERDLFEPCVSIHVGAWILAHEIRRFGYTWEAVGAYNAGPRSTPERQERRRRYAHRVYRFLPGRGAGAGLRRNDRSARAVD